MNVSLIEGGVAYVPVRPNEGSVACVTVSPIERCVADVLFSSNGGVAFCTNVPFSIKNCHDKILAQ